GADVDRGDAPRLALEPVDRHREAAGRAGRRERRSVGGGVHSATITDRRPGTGRHRDFGSMTRPSAANADRLRLALAALVSLAVAACGPAPAPPMPPEPAPVPAPPPPPPAPPPIALPDMNLPPGPVYVCATP